MWTGTQTLQSIDRGLQSVRSDINRLELEMANVNTLLADNQQFRNNILIKLSEIRLEELESGRLVDMLKYSDTEVVELLRKREQALEQLENQIELKEKKRDDLEESRGGIASAVEECGRKVVDREHQIQEKLEQNKEYQSLLEKARHHDFMADEAEGKEEQAKKDSEENGKPFKADALFMYLWNRNYGTIDYKANKLVHYLDDWVATLCNYDQNRLTYWTLLELPVRLGHHATEVRAVAEGEAQKLILVEKDISASEGLPQLHEELRRTEKDLEETDADIAKEEESLRDLRNKKTQYLSRNDEYSQEGIRIISRVFESSEVAELHHAVKMTRTSEDDKMVREFQDLCDKEENLKRDLAESRGRQGKLLDRLRELEDVRKKFKQHRFDDLRSGFSNEAILSSLLAQFLNGMVSGGDLWSTISRHQEHRDVGAWPDFGSGGLGRRSKRRRSNVWFEPGRSRGGFRLPRSGGFSSRGGGGFRTGGGF